MPTFSEVRAKYPEYKDLSDQQLAEGLHNKFYSDMPFNDFAKRVGYTPQRYGTGKSFDVADNGSLVPSQDVYYAGSGQVPATSGIAQRDKKYGAPSGVDFSIRPEDVQNVRRSLSPIIRGPIDAITSLPLMAADTGISLRNLATGSNYPLTTQYLEQMKNQYLPMPNVPGDQTLEFGISALTGAKLPLTPSVENPAPANFVKPNYDAIRQETLAQSQKAGYVVPPSTTNPTLTNKLLESLGGKVATAQDAAARNQDITNTLAKRAVGLSEDAPIGPDSLAAVRREAGDAYDALRKVASVPIDEAASKSLDSIAAKFSGSKLKDVLGGGTDIPKIVQTLKEEPLTGDTAVDAIALLRDKASAAYASGSKEIGKGYRALSSQLENLMEKQLSGEALQNFRDARQLIAKTYSVEEAFNPATGNVVATKLASQLGKGRPLSGDLLTAAKFGQAFPKAAQAITDSGAVRNTDVMMSAGTAALSKDPWWLGYPFLRQGARAALLSPAGQSLAMQTPSNGVPPQVLIQALLAAEAARRKSNPPLAPQ